MRPRRSVLYMPGSNARALEKARTLPADCLILDLEDAVAPEAKASARAQVLAAVQAKGFGGREVVVRINGLDTPWGKDDLAAAVAAHPDAILAPKVSSAEELIFVGHRLVDLAAPPGIAVWAMIEPARAILGAGLIAAEARDPLAALKVFVLGTNDLAKETRMRIVSGRGPIQAALTTVCLPATPMALT
jgi:citrate lyase subunit beta / citryl-CoA lyase